MPRTTVALNPRERPRLATKPLGTVGASPCNLETGFAEYIDAYARAGQVWVSRSNTPTPPFAIVDVAATSGPHDGEPRLVIDTGGRLVLFFARDPDGCCRTYSDDRGRTWGAVETILAGAKHPTVGDGKHGQLLIYAGYLGGVIVARRQASGEAAPGAQYTFAVSGGGALAVEDDSFQLVQSLEGPMRWVLHVRVAGEGATSRWWSADNGLSWVRFS